ncbi:hypothetical protein Lalb_Chr09g0332611 [Lupinus albus]|uniref:Uncharacterized protein n=1 Tax=Lupinus albus TaxID=3870 RepID=A0A6A4Q2E2_LUPAL|nr:hypothetical protein Lalb_Chr09g0332611 [Lupinus albus]
MKGFNWCLPCRSALKLFVVVMGGCWIAGRISQSLEEVKLSRRKKEVVNLF